MVYSGKQNEKILKGSSTSSVGTINFEEFLQLSLVKSCQDPPDLVVTELKSLVCPGPHILSPSPHQ